MAISAGNDGLYEFRPGSEFRNSVLQEIEHQLYKVSDRFSLFSNYMYESIFSSSMNGNSYISMFKLYRNGYNSFYREYEMDVEESSFALDSLKNKANLSWGIRDKIYQASEDKLRVLKFNKWSEHSEHDRLKDLGVINLNNSSRQVKGGAASFGNIMEYEDKLVVIMSDNNRFEIPQEVTKWRIYPRSFNYLNQLHVILEDRVDFYSFNHDSNVNQAEKLYGIEYYVPNMNY